MGDITILIIYISKIQRLTLLIGFENTMVLANFINAAAIKCVMCHINYDLS